MKSAIIALAVATLLTTGSVFAADSAPATTTTATTTTTTTSANKPLPVKCGDEASYPLITKAELTKVVEAKQAFIVDVNSAESFKDAHVPTAIHYADHKKDFATLLPAKKDAMIVAYCGGPSCTAWLSAAKQACQLGYTNIHHFKDGISGWKKM